MVGIFQTAFSTTAAYTAGDKVESNGIVYEALSAISASTNTPFDNINWKPLHVVGVNNVYGIIEAIRLEAGLTKNNIVNDSVLHLMGLAQDSYERVVRVPEMMQTRTATVAQNAQGESFIEIPDGLLEPSRVNIQGNGFSGGYVSIKFCDPTEWRKLHLFGEDAVTYTHSPTEPDTTNNTYGIIVEGNRYKIAPALPVGTIVEVYGYFSEPKLGRSYESIDSAGNQLNSAGQTLAAWTGAGNSSSSFVPAVVDITTNWFSRTAPGLVIYATLLQMKAFVKDEEKILLWGALMKNELESIGYVADAHNAGGEDYITLQHGYPS